MIAVLFVILCFGVAALALISKTLQYFLTPILVLIFILFLYMVALVIYRYRRFGITEFSIFQKRKETKFSDMILMMLDKIEGFRRIVKIPNFSDMILIDETGIYVFQFFKQHGAITGKRKSATWTRQESNLKFDQIENPFIKLDANAQILKKHYSEIPIFTCLITNNICTFSIDYVSSNEIISLKDFYYKMGQILNAEKVLTKEQVQKIYKELLKKVLK